MKFQLKEIRGKPNPIPNTSMLYHIEIFQSLYNRNVFHSNTIIFIVITTLFFITSKKKNTKYGKIINTTLTKYQSQKPNKIKNKKIKK